MLDQVSAFNPAVTFDTFGSVLPTPGSTYYYLFQFGDYSASGLSVSTTKSSASGSTTVTHTYMSAGLIRANLTISDTAFTQQGNRYISIPADGTAVKSVSLVFNVLPVSSGKSDFVVTSSWRSPCTYSSVNCAGDGNVILEIGAVDLDGANISSTVYSVGEKPLLTLSNDTHTFPNLFSSLVD